MNKPVYIWMRHVTYEWVMSYMNGSCEWVLANINEPCDIWKSHVTYEWVVSHMNETCRIWMRHVTHECVMSNMNELCTSHIWMRCHGICMCVCEGFMGRVFDRVYAYICNIIHRHSGREAVQRVQGVAHMTMMISWTFRAHYEQALAEMVVWIVCSTPLSVTTEKQRKNVTFTGYRHTSLSGRFSMNGLWCTYGLIMAHTHMWKLLVIILLCIPLLVCVLCVWLCDCVCVWQRSQASLRATVAAQENRMQVARQDNQM